MAFEALLSLDRIILITFIHLSHEQSFTSDILLPLEQWFHHEKREIIMYQGQHKAIFQFSKMLGTQVVLT